MRRLIKNTLFLFLSCIIGIAGFFVCSKYGLFMDCTDIYDHFFKADFLLKQVEKGNLYPLYSPMLFNGIELFRYATPLPYYLLAGLKYFLGTWNDAYYAFLMVCFIITMCGWMLFGNRLNRRIAAFSFGIIYACFPEIQRMCLLEGNVPRILAVSLIPLLLYFLYGFIDEHRKASIIPFTMVHIIVFWADIVVCMQVTMLIFIFSIIYGLKNKECKYEIALFINFFITMIFHGVFLITGYLTGTVQRSQQVNNDKLEILTQKLWDTLSPIKHLKEPGCFYFNLTCFLVILIAIFVMEKHYISDFVIALICLAGTTTALLPFVKFFPPVQVFWMQKLIPMALCFFVIGILHWDKLRNGMLIFFALVIMIDSASYMYTLTEKNVETEKSKIQKEMLDYAANITTQRIAILDKGDWGSFPSYYLSSIKGVPCSNGFNAQGSATGKKMNSILDAFYGEFYTYAFDRLLYMGNDTILIKASLLRQEEIFHMIQSARGLGYEVVKEGEEALILHVNVPVPYGIQSSYKYLAIGETAESICYIYPEFEYGESISLKDYSVDELRKYDIIYLSGFTYGEKEKEENKLRRVAENGTKIFIDVQHIPINKLSGKQEFLDTYAQIIAFHQKFPILELANGSQFKLNSKTSAYEKWITSYISGLKHVWKECYYDKSTRLPYLGCNEEENIIFMGFNPVYYYTEVRTPELLTFLNETFGLENNLLPDRKIVPLSIEFSKGKIKVDSELASVNTNIAAIENLIPNRETEVDERMYTVDSGLTEFSYQQPYLKLGLIITALGGVGLLFYWIYIYVNLDSDRRKEHQNNEK